MTAETWYGATAFVLLAAIAATALAAPVLLVLFRRSVQRAMYARRNAGILPAGPPASQPAAQTAPLRIELVEGAREPQSELGRVLFARMKRMRIASAAIYAIAGIVFATVLAYADVREANTRGAANPAQFALTFTVWIWPAVIAVFAVATARRA